VNKRNYRGYYVDHIALIIRCNKLAALLWALLLYSKRVVFVQHMCTFTVCSHSVSLGGFTGYSCKHRSVTITYCSESCKKRRATQRRCWNKSCISRDSTLCIWMIRITRWWPRLQCIQIELVWEVWRWRGCVPLDCCRKEVLDKMQVF